MSIDLLRFSSGFYGMKEIDATNVVAPTVSFSALQVLDEATVTFTSNGESADNQTTFTALVIPTGSIIFGDFTEVNVASGKVLGYLK